MFLSIVVPVYNAELYLAECLDSLLDQDISKEEYEIICVNDGSTDNSAVILSEYSSQNVTVITQENSGVSVARNTGIAEAKGDYIWFVDADDFIGKQILKELKNEIIEAQRPDQIQIGAYSFYSKLSDKAITQYNEKSLQPNTYANNIFVTRSIFKKSFIEINQILFNPEMCYSEDKVFLSYVMVANPTVIHIQKAYYFYRYHAESAISSSNPQLFEKKMKSWLLGVEQYRFLYTIAAPQYKAELSDNMFSDLCSYLFGAIQLPKSKEKNALNQLKRLNLFPYKRPEECTLKKSFMTSREDFIGKSFDFLWLHLNTWWGYSAMRAIQSLKKSKKV